jgi:hypothetical protein
MNNIVKTFIYVYVYVCIHSVVWRQVQRLFQNGSSTYCDLELPPSNESILSCP